MKKKNLKGYEYTADERLVVNMVVKDDTNFLSVFSDENTPIISEEVADFLEASTQSIPPKQALCLKVRSDCIDEQEKGLYERGIKKYYTDRSISTGRELKRSLWIAVVLAVLGMLTLALAQALVFHSSIARFTFYLRGR